MKFDLQWTLRLLDSLELYLKQDQRMMVRGTIQRVRETLETYGRTGRETSFERLLFLEGNLSDKEKNIVVLQQLREDIQQTLNVL